MLPWDKSSSERVVSFWSAEEAAVECEFWKRRLSAQFGFKMQSSFDNFFDFETACRKVRNASPMELEELGVKELSNFAVQCERMIFELLPKHPELGSYISPEGGLNAYQELFAARAHKRDMEEKVATSASCYTQEDWDAADARIQWAHKLTQLAQLEEFLEKYGQGKLEAEAKSWRQIIGLGMSSGPA